MKREYLLAGVIILAVGGVVLFVMMGRNQTSVESSVVSDISEQTEGGSIVYTDSGYSPSELTIKAATTVVFANQSDLSMWTASDPHPVHTDFAEFDNRQGVDKGETYEFTFKKPGIYGYHNHLSPQHRGTITVK